MVTEPQRLELLQALERLLGASPANILMSLLPPFDWSDVARQSDLVALRADVTAVRAEIGTVRADLTAEIATVRAELTAEIATVRAELKVDIANLRTELKGDIVNLRTELKSDIADQFSRFIWANLATTIAVVSLVFAIVKLG